MSSRWYYQLMIEEFGPVNTEQLRELLESGTLSDGDLVRQESSEIWIPISDVRQSLFTDGDDDSRSLDEEIGDLSELAFEFEDSGPTTRRGAYAQDVNAEASPSIPTSSPVAPISSSATSLRPVTPPSVTPPPESPQQSREEPREEWFCESLGQVMGPMSFEELIELSKSGALDANDRVKCGERGVWKIVEHLPSVMRAVVLSRAIEVDPQMVSSTTQKRLGDAAYAAMMNSPDVSAKKTAPQQQLQPPTPKAVSTPPTVAAPAANLPQQDEAASAAESAKPSPGKSKATKPRPKRPKSAKGEDKLLDEIFDDVFNDDNAAALPKKNMHSISATPVDLQASPHNAVPQNAAVAPVSSTSSSTSGGFNASGSKAAGLAAAAMAARHVTSSKSSRPSFEINPKAIGIFVAILLVGMCGYYVWQNGIPFLGSANGSGNFDRAGAVKILEAAMARYKAVGTSPTDAEWKEFSIKTKLEMSALFKSVYERAGATPPGAECLASIMCLMKIAGTRPDNSELIDKNVEEFQKHIVLVTKD